MSSHSLIILTSELKKHKIILGLELLCIAISSFISGVVNAEMLKRISGAIINGNKELLINNLIIFAIALALLLLISLITNIISFNLRKHTAFAIEDTAIKHYSLLDYWNLYITPANALARVRQTSNSVSDGFISFIFSIFGKIIIIVSGSIYAITINPIVWVITVVLVMIILLLARRGNDKIPSIEKEFNESNNDLHGNLWEHIKNTEIARFLNKKRYQQGYLQRTSKLIKSIRYAKKIMNKMVLVSEFGTIFLIIVTAACGGVLAIKNMITLEEIFALVLIIQKVSSDLFSIPSVITNYKKMKGDFIAMDDYFSLKEYTNNDKQQIDFNGSKITVDNISFTYPRADSFAIHNITQQFNNGLICIVGSSGCGKSTFIKLISGLLPLTDGSIKINDIDINKYTRKQLYSNLCYLDQTPHIIEGTMQFNIIMNTKLNEELLNKVIIDADLEELVNKLPNGLETQLSKANLSNGELQKICFARAMYGQYKIYILDEATSALDPSSEKHILNSLKTMIKDNNNLVIFVTHRVECIKQSDQVIFIKNGEIMMQGNHEQLKQNSNDYCNLLIEGVN